MADVLKYGWAYGGKQGQEMKCARMQYFNRLGGAFVTASGATGVVKLTTASTDVIVGWAEVPRAAVPGIVDYWISDTTVGKDKIHVITDPSAVYCLPADESVGSVTASLIGRFICASLTAVVCGWRRHSTEIILCTSESTSRSVITLKLIYLYDFYIWR
jgi:hypothetical protein